MEARVKWMFGGYEDGKLAGETSAAWIATVSGTSFARSNAHAPVSKINCRQYPREELFQARALTSAGPRVKHAGALVQNDCFIVDKPLAAYYPRQIFVLYVQS